LAFGGTYASATARIHILDPKTHRVTALQESAQLFSPRWPPDRKYIAAIRSNSQSLMIFDRARQKWSEVFQERNNSFPNWSKDGTYLYFPELAGGSGSVPDATERLASRARCRLEGFSTYGTWDDWMGLDPNDSPPLLRDTGLQGAYALDAGAQQCRTSRTGYGLRAAPISATEITHFSAERLCQAWRVPF